jgi:hypothetical protein
MPQSPDLSSLVTNFTVRLFTLIDEMTSARIQSAVQDAFAPARRGPGRPRKNGLALPTFAAAPRKRAPKQLCPVPGCKNPAAPVFGMVCAKHKDVPKAKIKKYREARRAKKTGK